MGGVQVVNEQGKLQFNIFIADQVNSKEIRIEYCPTGIMLADYFTKPLQGLLFYQIQDMIIGNTPIILPKSADPPVRVPDTDP